MQSNRFLFDRESTVFQTLFEQLPLSLSDFFNLFFRMFGRTIDIYCSKFNKDTSHKCIRCDPFSDCLQTHFYLCDTALNESLKFIIHSNNSHYDQINEIIKKPARFHKFRLFFIYLILQPHMTQLCEEISSMNNENEALIKYNSNFNIFRFSEEINKEFEEFRSFKFTNNHVYYRIPDYLNNATPGEIVSSLSVLDKLISDNQFYNRLYKLQHNRFWSDYLRSTNLESNNIIDF
jgi:hypothetical protein